LHHKYHPFRRIQQVGAGNEKRMSLRRRVRKVEQRLADTEEQNQMANCSCPEVMIANAGRLEKFEEVVNQPCQVHGMRQAGRILCVPQMALESYSESDKELIRQANAELDEVLDGYFARLAAAAEADSSSPDKT
jgi:hypothetical protein